MSDEKKPARNWKTTTAGVISGVVAVLLAVKAVLDGDPDTVADWGAVAAAVSASVGLLLAKDGDK